VSSATWNELGGYTRPRLGMLQRTSACAPRPCPLLGVDDRLVVDP